jgi:tetratricopeptide (TPR) repeat protein
MWYKSFIISKHTKARDNLDKQYDVFLSHNSKDKVAVERIAHKLRAASLNLFLDKWHLVPGEPWQESLEDALDASATVAVFIGSSGISPWHNEELRVALNTRTRDKSFRVIPVLLPGAVRPDQKLLPHFLSRLTWVDFSSGLDDQDAFHLLLSGIRGQPPGIGEAISQHHEDLIQHSTLAFAIPFSPQPYYVNPHILQANFTGQTEIRETLTTWFKSIDYSILLLTAIGGMGKSAVSWFWLHNDIDPSSLDGVLWWSFTKDESSFTRFLNESIYYISGHKIDPEEIRSDYEKVQALITILGSKRILIVLDGFERQLQANSAMNSAYEHDEILNEPINARACINPNATRLLQHSAAVLRKSKVLITSRLMIKDLEGPEGTPIAGCLKEELQSMTPDDAVIFMRAQGISIGTDEQIEQACKPFGYHPLSLRLLSGLIARDKQRPGDIGSAEKYQIHANIENVLKATYYALPGEKQVLLSHLAAFRNPIDYKGIMVFNQFNNEELFDNALDILINRGLLVFDIQTKYFDMHPIIRSFAYRQLSEKEKLATHEMLIDYFRAEADQIAATQKLESIHALSPVIELYYHLLNGDRFDEAEDVFYDLLYQPIFYQFNDYSLFIELLRALFADGENNPPRLRNKAYQSWAMNYLASAYCHLGQLNRAEPIIQNAIDLSRITQNWKDLAVRLHTSGHLIHFPKGNLRKAETLLQDGIKLSSQEGDLLNEALGHRHLARQLVHRGLLEQAECELELSNEIIRKVAPKEYQTGMLASRATLNLFKNQPDAALEMAEKAYRNAGPKLSTRGVIRSLGLIGASYLARGELDKAETNLTTALEGSRIINRIELEVDILINLAKLRRLQAHKNKEAHEQLRCESFDTANDGLLIANRCGFRLKQADLHNLLSQWYLDIGEVSKARKNAENAQNLALCDGPPYFYKRAYIEAKRLLREIN